MHRGLIAFTLLCLGAFASDTPSDRATLRGIKSVLVAVDPTGPELDQEGMRAGDLQSRIEDRLRQAEIMIDPVSREFLGLRVMAVRDSKGVYAVCFSLGVYQTVSLDRDKTIHTATQTWETQSVVLAPPKQIRAAMDNTLDEIVDQFRKAFESANPKP